MRIKRVAAIALVAASLAPSMAMAQPVSKQPSLTQRYKHLYYAGRRDGLPVGKYLDRPGKTRLIRQIHKLRHLVAQWKRTVTRHLRFMNCVGSKESGGRYGAVSPDGTYKGKYQFDDHTWQAAGGSTQAASQAAPAEQDAAFLRWYPGHPGAWPRTGPACGGPAAF